MSYPVHELVGASPALGEVIHFIGKAARRNHSVLLEGESGTGKELVARAIHLNSRRSNCPFVAINCAALPETTLENELFGHEREAFTGALTRKKGRFELADGGTLFLDEIGEMTWTIQAKLLRAVEYGEIQRMGGGVEPVHADVRLIAATNRDMRMAVAGGDFREDFYYRLCVLPLRIPSLRERREDIPILARHFISTWAASGEVGVTGISQEAESILSNYHWPGNVRQLKHVIDRTVAFASGATIERQDLPQVVFESTPPANCLSEPETLDEAVRRTKREFVESVFRAGKGDVKKAAEMLGKHPAGLSRLLDSLGLSHLKKKGRRYGTA
jgi:transcriptional regulator with GAF, ATPase, and Fis domain